MTLTPEQKQSVAGWIAAGDSLSTVQKRLHDEFKISLTYMDVRFLVDDLGLELKNAGPKTDTSDVTKAQPARPDAGAGAQPPPRKGFLDKVKEKVGLGGGEDDAVEEPADEFLEEEPLPDEPAPAGTGKFSLDVDRIVRPGTVVSGTVTFSDGVSGKWGMDQYGRLLLETGRKGYQPSAADVQAFQRELQHHLQRQGY